MPALTSAAGLVGFLSEPDPTLQAFALERLNEEIDSVWTEVSGSIGQMYVLSAFLEHPKNSHAPWSCALAARLTS
jgi:26S proteasome regulatory subunit N2